MGSYLVCRPVPSLHLLEMAGSHFHASACNLPQVSLVFASQSKEKTHT